MPRYWELRENHNSFDEAIWTELLSVNGTLYDEPVKLFRDDVQDIVKTATIMSFVGVPIEMEPQQHLGEHTSKWSKIICRDAVTGNVIDGTLYGVAKKWWGTVLDKEKKPHQIELDVVAESLDMKKILIGECKW